MEKSVEDLALLFYKLSQLGPLNQVSSAPEKAPSLPAPDRSTTMPSPGVAHPTVAMRITVPGETFGLRREIAPLFRRVRNTMADGGSPILHVTAAQPGDGASTTARELAFAASSVQFFRTLLIDCNIGEDDQSSAFGHELPDIVGSCLSRGHAEVAAIVAGGSTFHAARLSPDFDPSGSREAARIIPNLYEMLRSAYELIVVDCPPVLEVPYFIRIAQETPEVLLVMQTGKTRIYSALRAKAEIMQAGGRLAGVVMNRHRLYVPKFISDWL
jgi:protein-tyrosine kinase